MPAKMHLTDEDMKYVREKRADGMPEKEIAYNLGVATSSMRDACGMRPPSFEKKHGDNYAALLAREFDQRGHDFDAFHEKNVQLFKGYFFDGINKAYAPPGNEMMAEVSKELGLTFEEEDELRGRIMGKLGKSQNRTFSGENVVWYFKNAKQYNELKRKENL